MKVCIACRASKPRSEFTLNNRTPDGLERKCKPCRSAYRKARYAADPGPKRAQDRDRRAKHREAMRASDRERYLRRRDNESFKVNSRANARRMRQRHRDRFVAREAVARAIRRGEMTRPEACDRCGCVPARRRNGVSGIEFDHCHGYEPENHLRGQWVCRKCHREVEEARGTYARVR